MSQLTLLEKVNLTTGVGYVWIVLLNAQVVEINWGLVGKANAVSDKMVRRFQTPKSLESH